MIIINPNNFSEVSSSLSGSFSGSMHGKIVSYVDENILSGSFTGSFFGAGTGSFHARELKGEIFEGDGQHVNNVFHFISSSTGEVSSSYTGSIKFMSLADLSDTYRGLEINAITLAQGFVAQNLGISGWTTNDEYGVGGASTNVHFKINDIHTNEGLHPYAAFPPYIVGNGPHLGLLNGTISTKFLGQNLAKLSGSAPLTMFNALNGLSVDGYSGSADTITLVLQTSNINTVLGSNPTLTGHEFLILEDSSNSLKNISANNGAISVLGNSINTNVFSTSTPTFGKLNVASSIVDTFSSLLAPGSSHEVGLTDNNATIRFVSNQIRFRIDGSDAIFYDDTLGTIRPAAGTNLDIIGDTTNEATFGTIVALGGGQFESLEITSSALQGDWHGTPAPNNIPFDSSDIDRLKHIPMCINGEINGTVFNGDWVSFGNGGGTAHNYLAGNDPTNQKSNLGVAMPLAGKIVRVAFDYNLVDEDRNIIFAILTINGVAQLGVNILAISPLDLGAQSAGQQTVNSPFTSATLAQNGVSFNAGDLLGFRFVNGSSDDITDPDYLTDQLALWDNYDSETDTDPNSAISNLNFSCYFVFE